MPSREKRSNDKLRVAPRGSTCGGARDEPSTTRVLDPAHRATSAVGASQQECRGGREVKASVLRELRFQEQEMTRV
jgi:hypothetical protein